MKILLVYPGMTECGFDSYGKGMESSWLSHGLCSISAYLKNIGHTVKLLDLRRLKGWEDFSMQVEEYNPDIAGITIMSVDYNPAMKSIELIKEVNSNIKTVVGGAHPTLMLNEIETNPKIDYIILGEGEISFAELIEKIKNGQSGDRVIQGIKPDLDKLPFADRDIFGASEYPLPIKGFESPFVTLIAGRGCVYNCKFCQPAEKIIFGNKVRRRSASNVIEELKILREKYRFESWMVHDDCLTEDRAWVEEFAEKYRENKFTQIFACQSRADIICRNEETVKLLHDAGLRLFFIGFESGNQRVLNFLRKGTKVEHNYKAAEICKKYDIKIWANYMMGIPTETKEEVMDTVNMIKKIKPDVKSPAFYTPHPGSDLFKYCEENNLSLITSHNSYRRNPTEAKIKGVDYIFLNKAMNKSLGAKAIIKNSSIVVNYIRPILGRYPNFKKTLQKIINMI